MRKTKASAQTLTDEEVLKEFVRRFECDGAVLIYLESATEFGFGRWRNNQGKGWVNSLFQRVKQGAFMQPAFGGVEGGTVVCLKDEEFT